MAEPALLLAEFDTADELIGAARKVREEGYQSWDAHSPYPVHGMEPARRPAF